MELTASTTVRRTPEDVYAFWRDLENLPTFMAHVEDVRTTGPGTSHWRVAAPFGRSVEWDAEIVDEQPGRRISWRSVGDADVANAGEVAFTPAPGDRGTELRVRISYDVPDSTLAAAVAKFFGEEPHQQLSDDLRRAKQVLEAGEVTRSDGAPWGKRAIKEFPQRPARPLTAEERAEVVVAEATKEHAR